MGISNTQYRDIMFQYDQTRMDNQRLLDARHEELYQEIPELRDIHTQIVELSVEQAKEELLNPEQAKEKLAVYTKKKDALLARKAEILSENNYPSDYLSPIYNCIDCKDTGLISGKPCHCFQQAKLQALYENSNLTDILELENFSTFEEEYYDDTTIQSMLAHMKELRPFNELEMKVYHSIFLDFCVLGGMPAVVTEYIQRNTFENSLDTQRQLISDYKEDIRKYAHGIDQTRILNVFNRIAPQLARENKKFQISKVASGARFRDYRGCAEWLVDAGMVNICYCLEFPELPLGGNYDPDVFKLYFADTGLLVSMLDDESQEDLRANKNLGVYKGALYENIVGEALVKQHYKLYYYKRDTSTLETDFFIRSMTSLIPVEVKATTGKAKSMNTLISSDRYPDIRYGFKFSAQNIGHENCTYTFPYFCIFLLKRFMADFHPAEENVSE